MAGTLRTLSRLLRITRVLGRHDALFLLEDVPVASTMVTLTRRIFRRTEDGRPGQRLARALIELGPTFIKLGQALSTRPDLVGDEVAADLADLQDKLQPFPFPQVREIIEAEFGCPLEDLYQSFDETPVAAASIAQVHFAVTADGQPVAVKVLRPGIEQAIADDVEMFRWLARTAERLHPDARRFRPVESVATFEESVTLEMDLRFEAASAAELAENFADDPTFRVPSIDWVRTGQRVMTQERISGLSLDERDGIIAMGLNPNEVLGHAARAFFTMVFRDGFFHADLHPGNLFVDAKGTIIAVDFGIMGRVNESDRRALGEMLLGFLTRDYRRVAEVQFRAGWVPPDQSIEAFTQAARSIAEPIFGKPIEDISMARVLSQLFEITRRFDIPAQPQLLLLEKSMLLAEGVGRTLAPDQNMWEMTYPLIEDWMRTTFGPEARIRNAALGLARSAERLPAIFEYADKAAAMISSGGLKLHPETVKALARQTPATPRKRTLLMQGLPWLLVGILGTLLYLR